MTSPQNQLTHFEIAKTISEHKRFRCTSICNPVWYQYENDKWVPIEEPNRTFVEILDELNFKVKNQLQIKGIINELAALMYVPE